LFFISTGWFFLFKDDRYPIKNPRLAVVFLMGILVCMISVVLLLLQMANKNNGVIYEKDGVYGQIRIVNQLLGDRPVTALYIDRTCEGAVYPNNNELPIRYANYYSLYRLINPEMKTTLFLGGGLYSMPRALLHENQAIGSVDVAEIDPDLYPLAREYFNLTEDKRLTNYIGDGRRYLVETDKQYGMIFADVYYSLYAIPIHFTTREFFQLAKTRLTEDGFILMNVIGSLDKDKNQFLLSEFKTFQSVFKNSYIIAVDSIDKKEIQNFIFVGIKNGGYRLDFASVDAKLPLIGDIMDKVIDDSKLPLKEAMIFTDNFSPIEKLTMNAF